MDFDGHSHLVISNRVNFHLLCDRLTKEHSEAKKKMEDKSIEADKKTFLKAQIPKMEAEIKDVKEKLLNILDSEELDPRGEFFLLAEKLVK